MTAHKRLVTKCDIDGMVSAALLKEIALIDRMTCCHPLDVAMGRIAIGADDITAGLPYREGSYLAFDHYPGGAAAPRPRSNLVFDRRMPSTSRVILNHFGRARFASLFQRRRRRRAVRRGSSRGTVRSVRKGFAAGDGAGARAAA